MATVWTYQDRKILKAFGKTGRIQVVFTEDTRVTKTRYCHGWLLSTG